MECQRNLPDFLICKNFVEHFIEQIHPQAWYEVVIISNLQEDNLTMSEQKNFREAEVLTAKEVQTILKVGNKTIYRLFTKNRPFRVIKIPGGYRIHAKSFFEWLDGKS